MVGRRDRLAPRVRPDHPALRRRAPRPHRACRSRRPRCGILHSTRGRSNGSRCSTCSPLTRCCSRMPRTRTRKRSSAPGARRSITWRSRGASARTSPPRSDLFLDPAAWKTRRESFARLLLRDDPADVQLGFFPPERVDRDLGRLRGLLGHGTPTLILCDNEGQRERLDELLEENGFRPSGMTLVVGALDGGFVMPTLRVLTDHEIFRRERRLRRTRRYRQAAPNTVTGALSLGDYVVHLEHGIGIYRGIQTLTVDGGHHRSGDPRVRRRRPPQRAALSPRPGGTLPRRRR